MNEEGAVVELIKRLRDTLEAMPLRFELLFVDDGSTDNTASILKSERERDPRVTILTFSRNFGHHYALSAGIDHARGHAIIMMDADLQDQPEEIPKLWAKFREGYDVVFAQLDSRKENFIKASIARTFWFIFGLFTGIKLRNPGVFRVVSRRVILALRQLPERHRFLAGLFSWVGFRQTSIAVERASRTSGKTKYGFVRMVRLCLHAITSFSRAPLRLATYCAGTLSLVAMGFAGWLIFRRIAYGVAVMGWASLMVAILVGFAMVLFMLGIMGEYIANILSEVQGRPLYIVQERGGSARDSDEDVAPPWEPLAGANEES